MLVVTSPQYSLKDGGVTVEEGLHAVDYMVVRFYFNNSGDLVWELHSYLVHGECHRSDVKNSDL